jgi:hypothetical protein
MVKQKVDVLDIPLKQMKEVTLKAVTIYKTVLMIHVFIGTLGVILPQ